MDRLLGNTKAWKSGATFVGTYLAFLLLYWTDTDPLQVRDFVVAGALSLGAAGLTFAVPNPTRK